MEPNVKAIDQEDFNPMTDWILCEFLCSAKHTQHISSRWSMKTLCGRFAMRTKVLDIFSPDFLCKACENAYLKLKGRL